MNGFHKFEPRASPNTESALRIAGVTISIRRGGGPPIGDCGNYGTMSLRFRSDDGGPIAAVRLRLLEGGVPFAIPDYPIELRDGKRASVYWGDPFSPAQLPFRGRLAVAAVSESGVEGEWFVVEVWDLGSWWFLAWLGSWFWPAMFLFGIGTLIWVLRRRELWSRRPDRREGTRDDMREPRD